MLQQKGLDATTVDAVAKEVELTKAALYYYFPSKDDLLFAVMLRHFIAEAKAIRDAVEEAQDGAEALRAIVRTVVSHYEGRMPAFRLIYMHGQVSGVAPRPSPEMIEQIRPMNDWMYGRAQELLERDQQAGRLAADANPRRLAFVAHMSALGVVMMTGMVEDLGDPLVHTDEQLIDELEIAFTKAATK